MKRILVIFFCLSSVILFPQSHATDSLTKLLPKLEGEKRVDALNNLAKIYQRSDDEKPLSYSKEALKLAEEINYKKGILDACLNISIANLQLSKFEESLKFSIRALEITEQSNDTAKSAECYVSIANAYLNMNNFEYAISNYKRAEKIFSLVGDSLNMGTVYNNLAVSYDNREILDTALVYYNLAFPFYSKMKNKRFLGLWYMNVGDLYRKQDKIKEALEYQLKAEPILIEANDKHTLMVLYSGLPYTYIKLNRMDEALVYSKKAVELGVELKSARELSFAYMTVADVYQARKQYFDEAMYVRKYADLKDSIFSGETSKTIAEMQSKYENEKKQKEIELKNAEIEKHEAKQIVYIGTVGFIALLVVLLIIGIRSKNKANLILSHQKKVIEIQKHLVEEKQKEVIDSINYAKRLQQAILATREEIASYLPDSFLYYKPKDIVAGDFYFFETTDAHIFYAAADCTGHGVPGAMVSVVCANALSRCVKEFRLADPGLILDKTRELVLETFSKNNNEVKDGMDISLLVIEKGTKKVFWSGANNPLWFIENGGLKEIKPNKQPIGKTDQPVPFTTHEINYVQGTIFYLFTDGYADQFGGERGKKFKYKQLQSTLLENQHSPLKEQADMLKQKFVQWKGDLEQVDDVCVIGFRL